MLESYLIQRLRDPTKDIRESNFKNGSNGGISYGIFGNLSSICTFDFMNNDEFRYSVINRGIEKIIKYSSEGKGSSGIIELSSPIHYICEKDQKRKVKGLIQRLNNNEDKLKLKEPTLLQESLENPEEARIKGWFELNKGFMFFLDQEMYKRTVDLFRI
ncbi:hypothetical protein HN865_01725 [Candidatus Woesearchaeota archaeon]|jgi:hypothetical protein|nr:hypothetical protein [Candidatus Woesearchaeota archaeon]MBT7237555.1 hypothetical protein [Candidatus Woesearchaeota archaeon]